MQLQDIDKKIYRKHLTIVIALAIAGLTILSLAISQSSIYLFTDRTGTHFWLNLMGVAISLYIVLLYLNKVRHRPFMREVHYVWQLKQHLNLVQRKIIKLEQECANNNPTAVKLMHFYYRGCRQLYLLDDNTITMSELALKSSALDLKISELQLRLDTPTITTTELDQF